MGSSEITVGELLYEAAVEFTEVTDYGVSLGDLLAGNAAMPPAGARFDISFRGSLRGPKLSETVTGIDCIHMRADDRAQLHIHGRMLPEPAVRTPVQIRRAAAR